MSGFLRSSLAGEAIAAARFFDVAAALEALQQLGQGATSPVAERHRARNFADALGTRGGGEISQETGFVDFHVPGLVP